MEIILAIVVGVLYSAGIYLLLRRSLTKLVLGIVFFSNATNLLVFVAPGVTANEPPFITDEEGHAIESLPDPLPQALVLTALVIGLGSIAFTLILKYKYHQVTGHDDSDKAINSDRL